MPESLVIELLDLEAILGEDATRRMESQPLPQVEPTLPEVDDPEPARLDGDGLRLFPQDARTWIECLREQGAVIWLEEGRP